MAGKRFIYLRDRIGNVPLMDLDTGEVETLHHAVEGHSGLRRQILVAGSGKDHLVETPEFAPITPELFQLTREHFHPRNQWNFDWPHLPSETVTPEQEKAMLEKLMGMCAHFPYDFKITGLQRRFLMYFTDGNHKTQRRFIRLCKHPDTYPFTNQASGSKLLRKYRTGWTVAQVRGEDAPPTDGTPQDGIPLLYEGPAWAVRFTLDGQDAAHGMCVVYVRDDGGFICSDWCQRDGRDVKYGGNGGIDLVSGESYTFDSWVLGPCAIRSQADGSFKPKAVKTTVVRMADEMKKRPLVVKVPTFEEALAKYTPVHEVLLAQFGGDTDKTAKELETRLVAPNTHLQKWGGVPVVFSTTGKHAKKLGNAFVAAAAAALGNGVIQSVGSDGLVKVRRTDGTDVTVHRELLAVDASRLVPKPAVKAEEPAKEFDAIDMDVMAEAEAALERLLYPIGNEPGKTPEAPGKPSVALPKFPSGVQSCPICSLTLCGGLVSVGNKCFQPNHEECLFAKLKLGIPECAKSSE